MPLDYDGWLSFDAPTPPQSPQTTSSSFLFLSFFWLEKEGKYHIMHVQLALLVHPQQTTVRVFVMCALLPLFSFLFDVVPFLWSFVNLQMSSLQLLSQKKNFILILVSCPSTSPDSGRIEIYFLKNRSIYRKSRKVWKMKIPTGFVQLKLERDHTQTSGILLRWTSLWGGGGRVWSWHGHVYTTEFHKHMRPSRHVWFFFFFSISSTLHVLDQNLLIWKRSLLTGADEKPVGFLPDASHVIVLTRLGARVRVHESNRTHHISAWLVHHHHRK